jgi:hypothetical protein
VATGIAITRARKLAPVDVVVTGYDDEPRRVFRQDVLALTEKPREGGEALGRASVGEIPADDDGRGLPVRLDVRGERLKRVPEDGLGSLDVLSCDLKLGIIKLLPGRNDAEVGIR